MDFMIGDLSLYIMRFVGLGIMVAAVMLCRESCWKNKDD